MNTDKKAVALSIGSVWPSLSLFNPCFIRGYLTLLVIAVYVVVEIGDSRISDKHFLERRARESNPQPLAGHHISSVAASHSLTLRKSLRYISLRFVRLHVKGFCRPQCAAGAQDPMWPDRRRPPTADVAERLALSFGRFDLHQGLTGRVRR